MIEKEKDKNVVVDHFEISEVSSALKEEEIPVKIYAKDNKDKIISDFNEKIKLSDETKTIQPSEVKLKSGEWKGNVKIEKPHYQNKIKVMYNNKEAISNEFSIEEKRWYSLQVLSGQEGKIKEQLEKEIKRNNLEYKIFQVLVPSEEVVEMKRGKKRTKNKLFFPGYILIEMILDSETKYVIENTPGIIKFIGGPHNPQPLQQFEVERIIGRVKEGEKREAMDVPFRIDDVVKVVDGPFNDFTGVVKDINMEKKKVKVMVSIFGRETPVELDFLQVELEKK